MNIFKLIWFTLLNLGRQVLLLPQSAVAAFGQRRRLTEKNRFEVERLDRIRNPSKYLGR